MAKWTQNINEEQHISKITNGLYDKGVFIEIALNNGEKINCQNLGGSFGNDFNGKNINNLKYRAEIKVLDETGETHYIDVLDILRINRGKEF